MRATVGSGGPVLGRVLSGALLSPSVDASAEHLRLIRKLESISDLTAEEVRALAALPLSIRQRPEEADIVREGDTPSECCLLIEGWMCRYKVLQQGQRQIFSFHQAGDIPDLQSLHLRTLDHSVGTLTPCILGFIPHAALHETTLRFPGIGAALWRDTLIEASIFREWLAGVGRRSGHSRIAHLLCELFYRGRSVGLTDGDRGFDMPITQAELGDALGLSTVHVNRVLQDLRRDGLIFSRGRYLGIRNWTGLTALGEFNPNYLHIRRMAA